MTGPALQTLSPIGFGAFKIGRNEGIKYPRAYELPTAAQAGKLLNEVLDLGINLIDTAPAYGLSEERIGQALAHRRGEFFLSTKVGETFAGGGSNHDFSRQGAFRSVERSLRRLRTGALDILLIHSDGRDLEILGNGEMVPALLEMKRSGLVRFIGFSGKTVAGAMKAMEWADVLSIEYHQNDRSHEEVLELAGRRGIAVLIKKPLASGRLKPEAALPFILERLRLGAILIGSLDAAHVKQNLLLARAALEARRRTLSENQGLAALAPPELQSGGRSSATPTTR
jgi:aryl-alcohol dehydrogenase-like predicted oxidoreductase